MIEISKDFNTLTRIIFDSYVDLEQKKIFLFKEFFRRFSSNMILRRKSRESLHKKSFLSSCFRFLLKDQLRQGSLALKNLNYALGCGITYSKSVFP